MKKITLLLSLLFALVLSSNAQTVFTENFDAYTKGGNTTSSGTTAPDGTDVYTGTTPTNVANFPTGTKVYQAGGMAKLGGSAVTGSMTSIPLNLSQNGGNFTISFDVKGWTTVEGNVIVTVTGLTPQNVTYTATMTGTPENKTLTFTGGQANSTITFATSAKRAYIDNVVVTIAGAGTPVMTLSPAELSFNSNINVETAAQTATVSASNLTVIPTYSITGADASSFIATGALTTAGGNINVTFKPTTGGNKTATLTVTSSALTKTVTLTGKAIDPANPYNLDDSTPLSSLNETFGDGTATGPIPTGWSSYAVLGDRNWDIKLFTGNTYAQMSSYNGTGIYQTLLISPAINFNTIDKANVKFDWNSGHSNGAILKVFVLSKDGTKSEVKSINDNVNTAAYGTFTTETLDLSTYSGTKFLAFEYNGEAGVTTTTYQVDNVIASIVNGVGNTKFQQLGVWISNGMVNLEAANGETIEVYNAVGQKIMKQTAVDGLNTVSVNNKGVTIVKVANRVGKVIL